MLRAANNKNQVHAPAVDAPGGSGSAPKGHDDGTLLAKSLRPAGRITVPCGPYHCALRTVSLRPAGFGKEQANRMAEETALDQVMLKLRPEALPVFNRTVQQIIDITRNDRSSSYQLSRVILSDPSMTTHVLQVANRVPYNPNIKRIATVSQAVLVLGFETIARLSLTKAFIDVLLDGKAQQYLLDQISESLHAAVQAQSLAVLRRDPSPEDVFIATLLKHIGDIALWSIAPQASGRVAELMHTQALSMSEAQRSVFGFSGIELTSRLADDWHLGELLSAAVAPIPDLKSDPRLACIQAGEELARIAATGDEAAIKAQNEALQKLTRIRSERRIDQLVEENTQEALLMARHFGLPTEPIREGAEEAEEETEEVEEEAEEVAAAEDGMGAAPGSEAAASVAEAAATAGPESGQAESAETASRWMPPDPESQLRILSEINELLEGQPNINLLLEMVAEGIYRGGGMDTVFFALMTPRRDALNVRFVLSMDERAIEIKRVLPLNPGLALMRCIETGEALLHTRDKATEADAVLRQQARHGPFLLKSIHIGKTPIGVLYADRAASGREIDSAAFQCFKQFCQQANLGLAFLKGR